MRVASRRGPGACRGPCHGGWRHLTAAAVKGALRRPPAALDRRLQGQITHRNPRSAKFRTPAAERVPALAVPVRTKIGPICPTSHLKMLDRDLEQVTHILIVGWRGQEQHFLERLRDRLPHPSIPTFVANGNEEESRQALERINKVLLEIPNRWVGLSPAGTWNDEEAHTFIGCLDARAITSLAI